MDNKLGGLITLFIVILMGAVLIDALGNEITKVDDLGTATNETVTITSLRDLTTEFGNFTLGTKVNLAFSDLASFSELRMENGTVFTANTDYVVNLTSGYLYLYDTTVTADFQTSNITLADYTYNPDAYVKDSISRTILTSLILIFFVIGLVIYVYGYIRDNYLEF